MILTYSDPHLGLTLGANTTVASRRRLQLKLEDHLREITAAAPEPCTVVCGGDFFHKHQNPEDVILRAATLAHHTDIILGGNHDVTNIADRKGSLDLLAAFDDKNRVMPVVFGKSVVYSVEMPDDKMVLTMVPHHTTQELFEQALDKAEAGLQRVESGWTNILLVHSNYDCQFASDETSLNLRAERAIRLLDVFDYVLLGHDHHPREDLDDRLIIIGNTHPTGFGDISDKRILKFGKGGWVEEEVIWRKDKHYLEVGPDQLSLVNADTQFLRIVGELAPSELHPYTRVLRKMWAEHPDLYAVRSEVIIKGGDKMAAFGRAQTLDIKQLITEELRGNPELFELWEEISSNDH